MPPLKVLLFSEEFAVERTFPLVTSRLCINQNPLVLDDQVL